MQRKPIAHQRHPIQTQDDRFPVARFKMLQPGSKRGGITQSDLRQHMIKSGLIEPATCASVEHTDEPVPASFRAGR